MGCDEAYVPDKHPESVSSVTEVMMWLEEAFQKSLGIRAGTEAQSSNSNLRLSPGQQCAQAANTTWGFIHS